MGRSLKVAQLIALIALLAVVSVRATRIDRWIPPDNGAREQGDRWIDLVESESESAATLDEIAGLEFDSQLELDADAAEDDRVEYLEVESKVAQPGTPGYRYDGYGQVLSGPLVPGSTMNSGTIGQYCDEACNVQASTCTAPCNGNTACLNPCSDAMLACYDVCRTPGPTPSPPSVVTNTPRPEWHYDRQPQPRPAPAQPRPAPAHAPAPAPAPAPKPVAPTCDLNPLKCPIDTDCIHIKLPTPIDDGGLAYRVNGEYYIWPDQPIDPRSPYRWRQSFDDDASCIMPSLSITAPTFGPCFDQCQRAGLSCLRVPLGASNTGQPRQLPAQCQVFIRTCLSFCPSVGPVKPLPPPMQKPQPAPFVPAPSRPTPTPSSGSSTVAPSGPCADACKTGWMTCTSQNGGTQAAKDACVPLVKLCLTKCGAQTVTAATAMTSTPAVPRTPAVRFAQRQRANQPQL